MQTHPQTHTWFTIDVALNYRSGFPSLTHAHMQARHITYFLFLKPEGRYGPREAWDHMGWVGHPAH